MKYVEAAMDRLEKNPTPANKEMGVLEKLMKLDRHVAKIMAFDMLLAGVDTTASGFIGILYCLAKNPEKQQKLREEICQILPNKDSPLTAENMRNLPYLRAVIREGLRIFAPTVGTVRAAGTDMVLQGYQIPRDVRKQFPHKRAPNCSLFFRPTSPSPTSSAAMTTPSSPKASNLCLNASSAKPPQPNAPMPKKPTRLSTCHSGLEPVPVSVVDWPNSRWKCCSSEWCANSRWSGTTTTCDSKVCWSTSPSVTSSSG
jgi:Cytochrome P450